MTCATLLADIALAGARGINRQELIDRHGYGVLMSCDVLVQLKLVCYSELPYWSTPSYFVSKERGDYPRANSMLLRRSE